MSNGFLHHFDFRVRLLSKQNFLFIDSHCVWMMCCRLIIYQLSKSTKNSNLDILSVYYIWHQCVHRTSCWTRCFGHYECSPIITRKYTDFPFTRSDQSSIVEHNNTKEEQKYMAAVNKSNLDHVSVK